MIYLHVAEKRSDWPPVDDEMSTETVCACSMFTLDTLVCMALTPFVGFVVDVFTRNRTSGVCAYLLNDRRSLESIKF